jgi:hypothetical protein
MASHSPTTTKGVNMSTDVTTAPPVERTGEQRMARLFGLTGDAWMRHANPVSVWTRFSCLSLIALAIWSREWIGWVSMVAVAAAVVWMMVNPLLFGVPSSTTNWASKAVFGERIWGDRKQVEIPAQFMSRVPNLANLYSAIGLAIATYGLIALEFWPVVAGILITHSAKLWYLDRMVLLFEDMKPRDPTYASWEWGRDPDGSATAT